MLLAINFLVNIDNLQLSFARISPLEFASDVDMLSRKQVPPEQGGVLWSAPPEPGRLVMSRAFDGDRTLYEWRREAMSGKPAVRDIAIRHLDRSSKNSLHLWQISRAWPLRWTGPRYDALHGGLAFEEIEVVFNDLTWHGA